jgi:hypothetical protein
VAVVVELGIADVADEVDVVVGKAQGHIFDAPARLQESGCIHTSRWAPWDTWLAAVWGRTCGWVEKTAEWLLAGMRNPLTRRMQVEEVSVAYHHSRDKWLDSLANWDS